MREDWFKLDLSPVCIFRRMAATTLELEGRTRFYYKFAAYFKFLTQFGK